MTSLEEASALVWPREEPPHTRAAATHSTNNSGTLNDLAHSVSSAVRGFMERSKRAREAQQLDDAQPSIQAPWVDALLQPDQGYTQVIKRSDFTVDEGGIFPRDHMFRVLLEQGLIHDALVLFKDSPPASSPDLPAAPTAAAQHRVLGCRVVSVTLMGHGVCGHPGIMHGGMTAALIDETCGYLLYLIRHKGLLDFAAVVTASLEVQYKQPLVPDHPVAVTAWVREIAGRKIWVEVVVADAAYTPPQTSDGAEAAAGSGGSGNNSGSRGDLQSDAAAGGCGRVYATGKALFIIPKPQGSSSALLEQRAGGRDALGQGLMPQRATGPRYEGNPADV